MQRISPGSLYSIMFQFNNAGYISRDDGPMSIKGKVEALGGMYRINLKVACVLTQGFVGELIKSKGTHQVDSL